MIEPFTNRARKVLALANQEAQRFKHEYIGTEHILLGLVKEGSGVGATVLKNHDVDIKKLRLEVKKLVKSNPDMVTMGKLPRTPRAKKVIEYAIEEARSHNHTYVGTEHILLGLFRENKSTAAQVLMNLGLKLEDVRQEVLNRPIEAKKQDLKTLLTKGLTRTERLIVVHYYYNKMTIKEIAKTLDLSESRVSQMHSSIVARLKAQMTARKRRN